MANDNYKSYDELPLMLDAKTVKDIMGVSIGLVYELKGKLINPNTPQMVKFRHL